MPVHKPLIQSSFAEERRTIADGFCPEVNSDMMGQGDPNYFN